MELKPGDKLGAYEIVSLLGKGGMGEVWRARDPQIGRDVAVKVSAEQFTDRFEREVRAIGALNHGNSASGGGSVSGAKINVECASCGTCPAFLAGIRERLTRLHPRTSVEM